MHSDPFSRSSIIIKFSFHYGQRNRSAVLQVNHRGGLHVLHALLAYLPHRWRAYSQMYQVGIHLNKGSIKI